MSLTLQPQMEVTVAKKELTDLEWEHLEKVDLYEGSRLLRAVISSAYEATTVFEAGIARNVCFARNNGRPLASWLRADSGRENSQ